MTRSSLALAGLVALAAACGTQTATEESQPSGGAEQPRETPRPSAPAAAPESAADREIRRELEAAIAHDPRLRNRQITFEIVNGDLTVTGAVGSEDERKRFNELAMNIAGVKSVANALRVEEK